MVTKRLFNFRLTDEEARLLASYAEQTGRTQSDVLREYIRSLKPQSPRRKPTRKRRS